MTEGPWDGSDLPPQAVVPAQEAETPRGGGGGGGGERPPEAGARAAERRPGRQPDEWPDLGVKPSLGGLMI